MTAILPFHDPRPALSNALAIRRALAATRRLCPQADVENVAEMCVTQSVPLSVVKAILFDQIAASHALRPSEITFTRAGFSAVLGAERRRA